MPVIKIFAILSSFISSIKLNPDWQKPIRKDKFGIEDNGVRIIELNVWSAGQDSYKQYERDSKVSPYSAAGRK